MSDWVIEVFTPDLTGNPRTQLTPEVVYSNLSDDVTLNRAADTPTTWTTTQAAIEEITWEVTPEEDSLRATIRATKLDITEGDIVRIYTRGFRATPSFHDLTGSESTDEFYPRFAGYVVTSVNSNDAELELREYQLRGLSQTQYKRDSGTNVQIAAGTDLGNIASTITLNGDLNGYGGPGIIFNTIGQVNSAPINPGSVSLGQILDILAGIATGAGTNTVWMVSPYIRLNFKKDFAGQTALTTTQSFSELNEDDGILRVEWDAVQADDIITKVRWVIADGWVQPGDFLTLSDNIDLETPDTLTHISDSGDTTYEDFTVPRQVPAEISGLIQPPFTEFVPILVRGQINASYLDGTADTAISADNSSTVTVGTGKTLTVTSLPAAVAVDEVIVFNTAAGPASFHVDTAASAGATSISGDLWTYDIPDKVTEPGITGYRLTRATTLSRDSYVELEELSSSNTTVHWVSVISQSADTIVAVRVDLEPLSTGHTNLSVEIDYQFSTNSQRRWIVLKDSSSAISLDETYVWGDRALTFRSSQTMNAETPTSAGDQSSDLAGGWVIKWDTTTGETLRLYTAVPLKINSTDLDNAANEIYKTPERNQARITFNQEIQPSSLIDLTTADSTVHTGLTVKAYRVNLGGENNVNTTVFIGPVERPSIAETVNKIADRDAVAQVSAARIGQRRRVIGG